MLQEFLAHWDPRADESALVVAKPAGAPEPRDALEPRKQGSISPVACITANDYVVPFIQDSM